MLVWKGNQPVYMASNSDGVEPMGTSQRYSVQLEGEEVHDSPPAQPDSEIQQAHGLS